jgi:geranylgeranyl transferase type-2 subunit beta
LDAVNVDKAAQYILACCSLDGHFGCVFGAESHAGQVFCCIVALSFAKSLHLLDADLLPWLLAEHQVDLGGLNGRPEKQVDRCYLWWILLALSILGHISGINGDKLATFMLKCQDKNDGGIADWPDNMANVFQTCFWHCWTWFVGPLTQEE